MSNYHKNQTLLTSYFSSQKQTILPEYDYKMNNNKDYKESNADKEDIQAEKSKLYSKKRTAKLREKREEIEKIERIQCYRTCQCCGIEIEGNFRKCYDCQFN